MAQLVVGRLLDTLGPRTVFMGVAAMQVLFFGIMPGTAVYTWVGAGLGAVFAAGQTPNLGIIFEPQILGPLLGLGALALIPVIVKFFRKEG